MWIVDIIKNIFNYKAMRTYGVTVPRSSGWTKARKEKITKNPNCECCNRKATQVHHVKPFHLHPELELEQNNLISLCDDCHILFGHLINWKSYNVDVIENSKVMNDKIKNRP